MRKGHFFRRVLLFLFVGIATAARADDAISLQQVYDTGLTQECHEGACQTEDD